MAELGIRLQMLIGQQVPLVAPLEVNEALQSVEVTHGDEGRSGFQLTFGVGRGLVDLLDYSLVTSPLMQPFNRVVLIVYFGLTPHTLMDGILTNLQLAPSNDPGASTLTATGEDVSVMLDLEQKTQPFPMQPDNVIVTRIITSGQYLAYGLMPDPTSALMSLVNSPPNPQDNTPTQPRHMTDWAYIQELAQRYGFVLYVKPGPLPGTNSVYWGPPVRGGQVQPALSVNMGPHTNVNSISFQFNGLSATKVTFVQDENEQTFDRGSRQPPLARQPATPRRSVFLRDTGRMTSEEAETRAQGMVDESMDQVVTASGELDALRYGGILEPRGLVAVRGVGQSYDGTYYVKSVTHRINVPNSEYKQSFSLSRDGLGALSPVVRV